MPTETIELTGEGAIGLVATEAQKRALVQLPVRVKLGRRAPLARPACLRFADYVRDHGAAIPQAVDYYTRPAASIARMYLNDRYGCCVWSGKAHAAGIWSVGDTDSGPLVLATDSEIEQQYFGVCGRGDNGCYIPRVLDYGINPGWMFGGKRYKLRGYASVDWRSKELVQTAIALFGALAIGFSLPGNWPNQKVWDLSNARIVGGHDVTPCGYGANVLDTSADGVVVSSWGRLYLMTWNAFCSTRYLDECYVMVPEFLWTGADQKSPYGMDVNALLADMAKLDSGNIPPIPDPIVVPPVPPSPPVPPPPPPLPPELHGFAEVPAQTVMVPHWFGEKAVTIPASRAPVTVQTFNWRSPLSESEQLGAVPWLAIAQILWQFGREALPIIYAGIQAGKSVQEIIRDVIAALGRQ